MLMKVNIRLRDGSKIREFFAENFGPMEGSCMIAFYYPDTEGETPDLMIPEDVIQMIEVIKVKGRDKK